MTDAPRSWLGSLFNRVGRVAKAAPVDESVALNRRAFLTGKLFRPMVEALVTPLERAEAAALAALPKQPSPQAQAIARTFPVLRPPGAVGEADFLAGCTRCGDCITACPLHAVVLAPERLRVVAGTPIIDPAVQPCLMCEDTPCITACEPAVLRRAPGAPVPAIGTARIQIMDCLAHQGSTCSACHERCPVPGAFRVEQGRPTVVAEACTGCGICQHVCPAPHNAVIMLPLAERSGISSDRL